VFDLAVLACALANVVPVACALGGYGVALLPYVPQLPLEWAALAVGYGSWIYERRGPVAPAQRLQLLGVLTALLFAAGALESYTVPHRPSGQLAQTGNDKRARIHWTDPRRGFTLSTAARHRPQQNPGSTASAQHAADPPLSWPTREVNTHGR
jgi:hypothetical protein